MRRRKMWGWMAATWLAAPALASEAPEDTLEPLQVDDRCGPWALLDRPVDEEASTDRGMPPHLMDTRTTPVGNVLTKDFLQKVPTGRSYQEAVQLTQGVTGGSNPHITPPPQAATLAPPPPPAHGPYARTQEALAGVDWGATLHLSNDDAMSLASAHRTIAALLGGRRVPAAEIRPHEFLNALTFLTPPPAEGDLFGIVPEYEARGPDAATLAMAITAATPPRPPLDLTLLIDRSGSMQGDAMMLTKRALAAVHDQLRDGDRLDVVLFDDQACAPFQDYVVGRDPISVWQRTLHGLQPRNFTDFDKGLRLAYRIAAGRRHRPGRAARVMVFTDALLNTGNVDTHLVSEVGRSLDEHGIHLSGVGVGSTFHDEMLNRLTEKGKGAYVFLPDADQTDALFATRFDALVQTVADDVRYSLRLPEHLGMTTFYGEEASTDPQDVQPVNVGAGTTQLFLLDLAAQPGTAYADARFWLDLSWTDPLTGAAQSQSHSFTVADASAREPLRLRKAQAIVAWAEWARRIETGDGCDGPRDAFDAAVAATRWDADLGRLRNAVTARCGFRVQAVSAARVDGERREPRPTPPTRAPHPLATKVRLDSDEPITVVGLNCPGAMQVQGVSMADQIARFQTTPGSCRVTVDTAIPLAAHVQVPNVGGDLTCVVRNGMLTCH